MTKATGRRSFSPGDAVRGAFAHANRSRVAAGALAALAGIGASMVVAVGFASPDRIASLAAQDDGLSDPQAGAQPGSGRKEVRPALAPALLADPFAHDRVPGTFVLFLRFAFPEELPRLSVSLYDAAGRSARSATWEAFMLERLADVERIPFGLFRSGEYRLVVAANGTELTRVRFRAEEADVVLDVPDRTTPTTALTVTVVDRLGASLSDALVRVGDDVARTDANGRALLTLNHGTTRLEATREGYATTAAFVELDADDGVARERIRLDATPSGRLKLELAGDPRGVRSIEWLRLVSDETRASVEVDLGDDAESDWLELAAGDWRIVVPVGVEFAPSIVRVRPNEDFAVSLDVERPSSRTVHRVVVESSGFADASVVWRGTASEDAELEHFERPGMRYATHSVIEVAKTPRVRVAPGERVRVLGGTIRGMPRPGVLRDRARDGRFWLTAAFEGWWLVGVDDADVLVRLTPGMDVAIEPPAERCALDFDGTGFEPTEMTVVQRIAPDVDAFLVSRPACTDDGVWEIPLGAGPLWFRTTVERSDVQWITGEAPAPDHLAQIASELVVTKVDLGRHVPHMTIGLAGEAASDFALAFGNANAFLYRGATTADGRVIVLARRGSTLIARAEVGNEQCSTVGTVTGAALDLSIVR